MKKVLIWLFWILLIIKGPSSQAQQNEIDSLKNVLEGVQDDTSKVNTLNALSKLSANNGSYEQGIQYAQQALKQSEKANFKKGLASSYSNIGVIYESQGFFEKAMNSYEVALKIYVETENKNGEATSHSNIGSVYERQGNYENAMDSHLRSLKIFQETKNKKGIARAYNNIGIIYFDQGNFERAVINYLKSLETWEEVGDKRGMANCYNNMGIIYFNQDNYKKALENHLAALKLREELGNKQGVGASYNNIGIVYSNLENYVEALKSHEKSLKIVQAIGDKQGVARSFNNIGNIYLAQGNYEKALENQLKALAINREIGEKKAMALAYSNVGNVYLKLGKFEEALHYNNESFYICKKIGYKFGVKDAYYCLSEVYEKKGDFKQALNYKKLYADIKDTMLNAESSKQIAEMNTKYDSEKKDKELIKKDSEISRQQSETEKQNLQRNAFIIGFALVLVLAFFIYRGYRQKKTANVLLGEKNILIENQKELVEEKNLKITDSINYAKRIQQAILPSQDLIKSFLPESFIFFRPKDIVSGDFYWFSEKNDKFLIAVADCTGHGVPGAFMSMIGNTLLNEIVNVKNISEPDKILNELNKGIVNLLRQNDNESSTQDDGMDVTILSINKTSKEIEFAGANHFSYLFNEIECETLNGDVYSIGGMFGKAGVHFTSQKVKIVKGNTVYLFTDGFTDQFGGEKNTKFSSKRFVELLKEVQQDSSEKQEEKLIAAFDGWKGNNKQLDDVTIVGIRF